MTFTTEFPSYIWMNDNKDVWWIIMENIKTNGDLFQGGPFQHSFGDLPLDAENDGERCSWKVFLAKEIFFAKMWKNFVIEISDNIEVILAKEIFVFKMCDKIDFYLSWPKNLVYSKCATILILSLWLGLCVHFYQCIIYPLEVHSCPILGRISWTVYRLAFLTKKSRMPSKQSIFMRTLSMELEY